MYKNANGYVSLKFIVRVLAPRLTLTLLLLVLCGSVLAKTTGSDPTSRGSLLVVHGNETIEFPLSHTAVKADISGFIARVTVTQEFPNPFTTKNDAFYLFPLPENSAVDSMTMTIGTRKISGTIMKKEEARATYDAAKAAGKTASLLDQLRPNIFSQSVANINPRENVVVEISYVETLKYEEGRYDFVFPLKVGGRYQPGSANEDSAPSASDGQVRQADIPDQVSDGRDVSIEVNLDAGVPIEKIGSNTHEISVENIDSNRAHITLAGNTTLPDKDFILRYAVEGRTINDGLLVHRNGGDGFFTLILQPPARATVQDVFPKELVFVLDTSGSMEGFPIDKAKETIKLALDHMNPQDTFNIITFSGDTKILFKEPVPVTSENVNKAKHFLASRKSDGGTEMMKAIRAALDPSDAQDHIRIACFFTDGQVGDDDEIIAEVQKHTKARVFAMGFGSSPNRYLLNKMAELGRGDVDYVDEQDSEKSAANKFFQRVREPLLTDITIDWNGLPVADVYPNRIQDLFRAKPIVLTGRFTASARGTLKIKGKMSGRNFEREVPVDFPDKAIEHDVLASLWARHKIDELTNSNLTQTVDDSKIVTDITNLGLRYHLMTNYTSFVAVEGMVSPAPEKPKTDIAGLISSGGSGGGGISETVTVTAVSNTMSTDASDVITSRMIMELPLRGRNYLDLIALAPGVVPAQVAPGATSAAGGFAVNGQRSANNSFTIDGVDASTGASQGSSGNLTSQGQGSVTAISGGLNSLVSLGATQEITIRTSNLTAEYGRSSGAQVSVVTKAGTNQFHGDAFEQFGNNKLDANDSVANSYGVNRQAHHENIFGFDLGGPVRRDRTFFFGSYEALRLQRPNFAVTEVPGNSLRNQAANNGIKFLDAFPVANSPATGNGLAIFAAGFSDRIRHDVGGFRLDHRLSDSMNIFARFDGSELRSDIRGAGLSSLNTIGHQWESRQMLISKLSYTVSPTAVIEVMGGFIRSRQRNVFSLDNFGGADIATVGQTPGENVTQSFAQIDLNGLDAKLGAFALAPVVQRDFTGSGIVSKIKGDHSLKFGVEFRRRAATSQAVSNDTRYTFLDPSTAPGGVASQFIDFIRQPVKPVFENFAAFAQDEWKATAHLTFNYGVRWTLNPAPHISSGEGPIALQNNNGTLGIAPAGTPLWTTNHAEFAPRAGVSYETGGSKFPLVFRANAGLIYNGDSAYASEVFSSSIPFGNVFVGTNVPLTIGMPGGVTRLSGAPLVTFAPGLRSPYAISWMASVEHAIGNNQLISASVTGTSARRQYQTTTLIEQSALSPFLRLTGNGGGSDYNAFLLTFNRRLASGFAANVSYTWSKSVDNLPLDSIYRSILVISELDQRGPSDFDARHMVSGMLQYELPQNIASGFANELLRNWDAETNFVVRSATPVNVLYTVPTPLGFAYLRPDLVDRSSLYLYQNDLTGGRQINPLAFSLPAKMRQGTLGRNSLRGFPLSQFDFSVGRKFAFSERLALRFTVVAFNLLNHPNFANPAGSAATLGALTNSTSASTLNFVQNPIFGRSVAVVSRGVYDGYGPGLDTTNGPGGPRSVQFAVKFEF